MDARTESRLYWQARSLAAAGPGILVRTRGTTADPLWCFRTLDQMARETAAWHSLFANRDWVPGQRVVVALANRDLAAAIQRAATEYGLVGVAVPEMDALEVQALLAAPYLVTSPLTAYRLFLRSTLSDVRELWLTGDVTGQGALQKRLSEFLPDLAVRDVYALTEHPGPLAVSCAAGRWHWLDPASILRDGHEVVPGQEGTAVLPLGPYDTGDVVTKLPSDCTCGQPGEMVTSPVWGRESEIRWTRGGWLAPSHLAQAWYRTEGLSDRLRATLRRDPERGADVLEVECTILEGYDAARTLARFQELLERAAGTMVEIAVREARALWPPMTCQIADQRADGSHPKGWID